MGDLDDYDAKRDFSKSPEPRGRRKGKREPGALRFVIQEHAARSLHYDFRLEVGGVLKSWAVPKGPSTDPREKRLAVQVEDHPLDYASFEGEIGAGYGAGRVIVWDRGTWRSLSEGPIEEALERGHLSLWLDGEKLRGGWTLHRTGPGAKPQWLLIKRRDEGADTRRNPVSTQPESVISGRTVDEIGG
jgi:DNA ligase D-like protein (predicted 3'-phosphoesterase)